MNLRQLPPEVAASTAEPPEVAASAAEPPEVGGVHFGTHGLSLSTATEAIHELTVCPVTATEALLCLLRHGSLFRHSFQALSPLALDIFEKAASCLFLYFNKSRLRFVFYCECTQIK